MEEKYFDELRRLYADFKMCYKTRADGQRKKTCRQIKTKGRKYDVFPYQEERIGNKTKGKEIDEIEMKDDNFIFYFDESGRIRLVEEASTFLKRICDFECYEYVDNRIYAYYGSLSGVRRISVGLYKDGKIMEKYTMYSVERYSYEKYVYNDNLLNCIETCVYEVRKETRKWKHKFYFDQKNNLKLIQKIEGSWRENSYSTVKINNKKLEVCIERQVIDLWQTMFSKVHNMDNSVVVINLNLENDISDIDFFFEVHGEMQILEKKYNLPIRDLPLDRDEKEKIVYSVLKVMVRLWDEKCLDEKVCLKIIKDGVNILNEKKALPRWVQKNSQLVFGIDTIRYQHLDEEQKFETKKVKELFKDLQKSTNKEMFLPELVTHFEEMSKVIAKDASYDFLEDMFIVQAEVVTYQNKLMFAFSLVRQVPCKEEFVQLGMEVIYELNDANKSGAHFCRSEDVEGDFFSYVRSTDVYNLQCKDQVYDVRIFFEET